MSGPDPVVDARRSAELYEELAARARSWIPEWHSSGEASDFGTALLRIAARLGAEVTQRLDQVPSKISYDLLDWLHITGRPGHAARMPVVFRMAASGQEGVDVAVRVRLQAEANGAAIGFETTEALRLVPAPIAGMLAVDPGKDIMHYPPPAVLSMEQAPAGPQTWTLQSPAPAGATTLQLTPAFGLLAGTIIEAGGLQYAIVAPPDAGLARIAPPVGPAGLADGSKVVAAVHTFRPFDDSVRDRQEHALYIGDDNVLNLTAPAHIGFSENAEGALLGADLDWQYWGSLGNAAPCWLRLVRNKRVLEKPDSGSFVPRELHGRTSRWIKASPAHGPAPNIAFEQLALTINPPQATGGSNNPPVDADKMPKLEGVANNMSVPLNPDPFYPLGKVPRQFDAFYLACPEVFSKPSATATLHLTMADATLGPLVALPIPNNPGFFRVLAVAIDGALHRHTWSSSECKWSPLASTRPSPTLIPDAPRFNKAEASMAPLVSVTGAQLQAVVWSGNQVWCWTETLVQPALEGKWEFLGVFDESGKSSISQLILLGAGTAEPVLIALISTDRVNTLHMAPLSKDLRWKPVAGSGNWARLTALLDPSGGVASATVAKDFFAVQASGAVVRFQAAGMAWKKGSVAGRGTLAADHTPLAAVANNITWLIGKRPPKDSRSDVLAILEIDRLNHCVTRELAAPGRLIGTGFSMVPVAPGLTAAGVARAESFAVLLALKIGIAEVRVGSWRPDEPDQLPTWSGPDASTGAPSHGPIQLGTDFAMPGERRDVLIAALASAKPTEFDIGRGRIGDAILSEKGLDQDDLVELSEDDLRPVGAAAFSGRAGTLYLLSKTTKEKSLKVYPLHNKNQFKAVQKPNEPTKLALDTDFPAELVKGCTLLISYTVGAVLTYCVRKALTSPSRRRHLVTITPALPSGAETLQLEYRVYPEAGRDAAICGVHPTVSLKDLTVGGLPAVEVFKDSTSMRFLDPVAKPQDQAIEGLAEGADPRVFLKQAWETRPAAARQPIRLDTVNSKWSRSTNDVTSNPDLSWEYWNGVGWWKIEGLSDGTQNLKGTGKIIFPVPTDLAPTEVLGRSSHWIRARLVGGDYGRESFVISTIPPTGNPQQQNVSVNTDNVHAPIVMQITIAYSIATATAPKYVLTRDNGAWRDQSDANRSPAASVQAFVPVLTLLKPMSSRPPGPALYLVFKKPPSGTLIRILFLADDADLDPFAPLQVDALRDGRFEPVTAQDATRALGESGLLTLSLDRAPTESALFGETGFWLRLMPHEGGPPVGWRPALRGAYVNAVWAEAAQTQEMEVLGSSDGAPGQRHLLTRFPLLDDCLELRVREPLGDEEIRALKRVAADAVKSDVAGFPGHWVRWSEVTDPGDEDANARVYGLDVGAGEVRFGDGVHGAIPPVGRDAIVAFHYRHGGAHAANAVGDFAPLNLSTPIQGVEAVFAAQGAAGGADPENAQAVRRFAATRLRSRERAVTLRDLEQLALAASAQVAQARALRFAGGVRLVLVARDADPQPGQALRREVLARLLQQAGPASVRRVHIPARLELVRFRIAIRLQVADLDVGGAIGVGARNAVAALFDPVSGGSDGLGWPLGRAPSQDDVAACLVVLDSLDGIAQVQFYPPPLDAAPLLTVAVRPDQLAWLLPDGITIMISTREAFA